jgi:hypothetical protein
VRLRCIGAFELEWFSLYHSLYSILLIVNLFRVVSAIECRLIELIHLNLGVLCDCIILYSMHDLQVHSTQDYATPEKYDSLHYLSSSQSPHLPSIASNPHGHIPSICTLLNYT